MSTWHIEKMMSKLQHTVLPPKATDNMAIVVFEGQSCHGLLGPQTSLKKMTCALGYYRFHFIPLSTRTTGVEEQVSAEETGIEFKVHVEINYRVNDPVAIAIADPADLDAQVNAKVKSLLHEYDGKYSAQAWSLLQDAARQHLHRSHSMLGVKVESVVVQVNADSLLSDSGRQTFSNRQQIDVIQTAHQVDVLKQTNKQQLVKADMDFYGNILKQGRFDRLALLIADDSDKVREVVTYFKEDRDQTTEKLWKLFEQWLNSDDAPLIADRVLDVVKGIGMISSTLTGDHQALPQPMHSEPQPIGLLTDEDDEDLSDWIESIREEKMDEPDADDDQRKKTRDAEDIFL